MAQLGWDFKHEEHKFEVPAVGKHRMRIKSVEKAVSKSSGNDMLTFQIEVSAHSGVIYYYIPFLVDNPQKTNEKLTALFDSFGIPESDYDTDHWVGKGGAGYIKHDEEGKAIISYFIKKKLQDELPPWKDAAGGGQGGGGGVFTPMEGRAGDGDLPF